MNQRPTLLKPVGPANLADQDDFQLGLIRIRPSLCEVEAGELRERLEPRVMQVLVALAEANGAVVSRDDLILQCWGGRIVGDDAINRCVSRVRQLAELGGGKAFEIDTIPRVGYRLRQFRADTASATPLALDRQTGSPGFGSWRRAGVTVAVIAIAAALIATVYLGVRAKPEWIVAESHLPFIATPLIERYPALAPDGTMIAYSAGPSTNNRQIYLHLLNGGDPIQLTHEAYDATSPAWSADSRMIAYAIFREGHPCRLMEIAVPAGQPRQIGQCRVSERSSLAFHPSGRAIFFVDAPAPGAPSRIVKLDLDNGRLSPVTRPGGAWSDDSPTISPDGGALLYSRGFDAVPGNQVRLLTLSNGADRLVATIDDGDVNGTFSADGSTIFLSRSSGNENSLWAYPVHGGEPRPILSTGEYIGRLSGGPNGLLAMEMQYPGGQLVAVTPHSEMPAWPIDSGGLRTWCVDYARDGTFLATGWRAENFGIWISGVDGSFRELLRLPDHQACAIRWSPDGTRFAFVQWLGHGPGFDVPVMARSGAPIARLHFSDNDSGLLDWTADGRSILTSRHEKRGWRIWRTDLATPDKSVPITPYGWLSPRVHGTMLFAERDGVAGIWRIDGTPRRVTDGPVPDASDVYTIAGDRLIYSDTTDPGHPMFSAQNINGGPKDRLAPLPHAQINFTFGVDPKSGAIVYTLGTQDTDIGLVRLVQR